MCGRQEIWEENGSREDFADGDSGAAPPLGSCSMVHISPQWASPRESSMSSCPMCWLLPLPPSTEHRFCLLCFRCLENTTQCVTTTFTNLPEIFESRITFFKQLIFLSQVILFLLSFVVLHGPHLQQFWPSGYGLGWISLLIKILSGWSLQFLSFTTADWVTRPPRTAKHHHQLM